MEQVTNYRHDCDHTSIIIGNPDNYRSSVERNPDGSSAFEWVNIHRPDGHIIGFDFNCRDMVLVTEISDEFRSKMEEFNALEGYSYSDFFDRNCSGRYNNYYVTIPFNGHGLTIQFDIHANTINFFDHNLNMLFGLYFTTKKLQENDVLFLRTSIIIGPDQFISNITVV